MALSLGNHGVIVTHGIGDNMKPGELLADFTNSLADALMESPAKDERGQEFILKFSGRQTYPQTHRQSHFTLNRQVEKKLPGFVKRLSGVMPFQHPEPPPFCGGC